MKKLKLHRKEIIAEDTVTKEVEEILEDHDIKGFSRYSSHIILSGKYKGKKAIIGVYEK